MSGVRICSLVPGATEIIAALGLASSLVGRSHECDFPESVLSAPVLSRSTLPEDATTAGDIDRAVRTHISAGTAVITIDEVGLIAAAPDVIIVQELCSICGITPNHIRAAANRCPTPPKIVTSSPSRFHDLLTDIARIGEAVGEPDRATQLVSELRARLDAVRQANRARGIYDAPRVLCLEWLDPLFSVGHWIPELVELAGGRELLGRAGRPSRQIAWPELVNSQPDVLILMPCGYTAERATEEFNRVYTVGPWPLIPAVQTRQVFAVDGDAYFSRPGPRLIQGLEMLAELLANPRASELPPGVHRAIPPLLAPEAPST